MADPDQPKKTIPVSDSARVEMAAMLAANPRFTKRQGEPGVTTIRFVSKKQFPKKK